MDTQDRPSEPLPVRRSQAPPPHPVAPAVGYDDFGGDPSGGGKKSSFRLLTRALKRHWWQALLLWVVGSAAFMALAYYKIKPTYDAYAQLRVEVGDTIVVGQGSNSQVDFQQYIQSQVKLVATPPVLTAALGKHPELVNFPLLRGVADPEDELRKALRVGMEKGTNLIQVEMSSPVPGEAAEFVNAIVDAYIQSATSTYDASTQKQIERLQVLNDEQQKNVQRLRSDVESLQKKLGLSDTDALKDRNSVSADNYRRLSEQLMGVELRRIELKARLDQTREESANQNKTGGDASEEIRDRFYQHPRVLAVQEELTRAQAKRDDAARLARSPSDPSVTRWSSKVADLKKRRDELWQDMEPGLIAQREAERNDPNDRNTLKGLESDYAALSGHEQTLREKLDKLKIENKAVDNDALKFEFTRSDLNTAESVFQRIQANLSQKKFDAKLPVLRVESWTKATAVKTPNASKRTAMMAFAPLAAAALVLGLMVLLEVRGARVSDPDELATRLRVQVIGVVPPLPQIRVSPSNGNGHGGNGSGDGLLPVSTSDVRAQRQLDEFVQSLDHLRVALCAKPDPWGRDRHCVLITSAIGSEGKTTLAAQLAERCVNAGLMTLLVDADLRNPTLSRMLDAAENPGLINVLRGEVTPEDVVMVIGDAGGFHLLPAGTPRMDPSRLLQGDALGRLLAQARESFDMIIVDAPPVLPVPDALTIGKWTDGAVLAVRHDMSRFPLVERANRKLAHVGVPVIGAVINGMRSVDSSYGGYYVYGGYGSTSPAPSSVAGSDS